MRGLICSERGGGGHGEAGRELCVSEVRAQERTAYSGELTKTRWRRKGRWESWTRPGREVGRRVTEVLCHEGGSDLTCDHRSTVSVPWPDRRAAVSCAL